jgi:hypothetical protein
VRIDAPPEGLDGVRILPCGIPSEHILDHPRDEVRLERHAIRLAHAGDAVIGGELDEHEVPPTERRWWVADDESLDIFEYHGSCFVDRPGGLRPRRNR